MRLLILIWLLFICVKIAYAQPTRFILQGIVLDSLHKSPLSKATVILISQADSARTQLQVTDQQGRFSFILLSLKSYKLQVSYVGYQTVIKSVFITTTQKLVQLEPIRLQIQIQRLAEVRVLHTSPIQLKQDTVEYNADSFTVRPNSLLEELLQKLPGMEVRGDGTVLAQGQVIQQLFVDGKPFFGYNPRMATQNLPASLVKSVQLFDQKSEKAIFSGVEDGSRAKTINIITKPDGQHGLFGQQVAGLGTNGRYQAGVGLNKFGKGQQLSLLGQTNNVNQLGYSLPALSNRSNSGDNVSNSQGQTKGTNQSVGAGLNYADQWGKRIEVNAHYVFSDAATQLEQNSLRRTVSLTAGPQADSTDSQSILISKNQFATSTHTDYHSLNLRVNYRLNPANIIQVVPSLSLSSQKTTSLISAWTQRGQQPLNRSEITNTSAGTTLNASNSILWMHRFHQAGRTFSAELKTTLSHLNNNGVNASKNTFFGRPGSPDSLETRLINQRTTQQTHSVINEWNLIYTEPISSLNTLAFHYQFATNHSGSERSVIDANQRAGDYDRLNQLLSSNYQSDLKTNRVGVSWQMRQPGYTYTLGVDLQQTNLNSASQTGNSAISRHYLNLLPSLVIQPKLARNRYLQIQYQSQIVAPTVMQLQPVANVTNPLFIQLGNPTLRPEYTHLVSLTYNSFQPTTNRSVFALFSAGVTGHRIVNSTRIDSSGVQTTQPLNANGFSTVAGSVSLGRPVTMGSFKSTLNLTTNLNLIRGISLVNDQTIRSLSIQVSQALSLNATLGETLEMGLSALATYQIATYSLQPMLTNHSLNTLVSTQLYYPLPSGFKVATDINYRIATGRSAGYNQAYTLWNAYVSRSLFRQQQGELRVQVYDLLNQNRSLIRTVTDTYVEDGQSRVLKRYVLLSLIYNLRQFGSKKRSNL